MLPSLRVLCAKYSVLTLKDCTQSSLSHRNMRGMSLSMWARVSAEGLSDQSVVAGGQVVPCSKQFVHDWKECSFAHEGETARRRHPSLHTATPCPDFKSTKSCPRGDSCTMAHGPWEAGLHPDAFKTNLCAYGKGCQRRMCFFAHDGCELRSPQPGASQQLMQQPVMQMSGG